MEPPDTERPEERSIAPSEVWEQLSPDVQSRVCSLLARMIYKCALAQYESLSEETEVGGEIHSRESENHT